MRNIYFTNVFSDSIIQTVPENKAYRQGPCILPPMVYLKRRKFKTRPDSALKILGIHKGFLRLFASNPSHICEIFVIFFVFSYTR